MFVSEIKTTPPTVYHTELQQCVYNTLSFLNIPYERVDNDEAITMEDCFAIDKRLNMKTVKTLFVCNRQQTDFYLFVTEGDKPFVTKNFSSALGISRVSFASKDQLEQMLGTKMGAATILSLLYDTENKVKLIIDKDVLQRESFGCTDTTTTGYMKLHTQDVLKLFVPYTHHTPIILEL